MVEKDTDLQKIRELIEIMKQNDLLEAEIKHGDDRIFLKRCPPQQPIVAGRADGWAAGSPHLREWYRNL